MQVRLDGGREQLAGVYVRVYVNVCVHLYHMRLHAGEAAGREQLAGAGLEPAQENPVDGRCGLSAHFFFAHTKNCKNSSLLSDKKQSLVFLFASRILMLSIY